MLPKGNTTLNPGDVVPALLIGSNPIPPPIHVTPHLDAKLTSKVETSSKDVIYLSEMMMKRRRVKDDDIPVCACCGVKKTNLVIDDTPPPRYGGIKIENSSTVRIGVITVGDRASKGIYPDQGGPEVLRCINDNIKSLWESR